MNKGLEYSKKLHTFICEMENTLNDKNKRNRAYAPQVFWKNKYTLELIETELKRLEELEQRFEVLEDDFKRVCGKKQKQDEILRIIKRCPTEITNLIEVYDTWEEYAKDFKQQEKWLKNKAEFNLLKEWLK